MSNIILTEKQKIAVKKINDFYNIKPNAPIFKKEFGFYVLDKWISEGHLKPREEVEDYEAYLRDLFDYDEKAVANVGGLGWCEAGVVPEFEEKVLEDRGEYELVQDFCGRGVLCFKNRRVGFMPEYVTHPVKDMKTWEEQIKWRMDPKTPQRDSLIKTELQEAITMQKMGGKVVQQCVGAYMYLRSLMGPEELLYMFYDDPDLVHECMRTWFDLADARIAYHQKFVAFDELFFGEDICYNRGCLISPDMMSEFLLPYYQQLYTNMKKRNSDSRTLHFQIDTDGWLNDVVDIYKGVGCDYMSPFEVASNCDVVLSSQKYPNMLMSGGIDKRIIAQGGDDIKRHLDYIMPAMRKRGGFIPTCDHGVPEETPFENYVLYRKLMSEYCD